MRLYFPRNENEAWFSNLCTDASLLTPSWHLGRFPYLRYLVTKVHFLWEHSNPKLFVKTATLICRGIFLKIQIVPWLKSRTVFANFLGQMGQKDFSISSKNSLNGDKLTRRKSTNNNKNQMVRQNAGKIWLRAVWVIWPH